MLPRPLDSSGLAGVESKIGFKISRTRIFLSNNKFYENIIISKKIRDDEILGFCKLIP